jgi:tetratricopeptide (TPR) repeat protein
MSEKLTFKQSADLIREDLEKAFYIPTEEEFEASLEQCEALAGEAMQMSCDGSLKECAPEITWSDDYHRITDCYLEAGMGKAMPQLLRMASIRASAIFSNCFVEKIFISGPCVSPESIDAAKGLAARIAEESVDLLKEVYVDTVSRYPSYLGTKGTISLFRSERVLIDVVDGAYDLIKERNDVDIIVGLSGLPKWTFDADGDGEVNLIEALALALTDEEFERYLPILDSYGLKHPHDSRDYPPEIMERIECLAAKVESEIGLSRGDEGFCEAFIPAFIEAGGNSFADGGLCFTDNEPRTMSIRDEPELTSAEAFAVCTDPDRNYGSCSEMTYKIAGAVRATGVPCKMSTIKTETHAFPAHEGVSFDPVGLGEIGWSRETYPTAMYYNSLAFKDSSVRLYGLLAKTMDPDSYYDSSAIKGAENNIRLMHLLLGKAPSFDPILTEFDEVITQNPGAISPFNHLGSIVAGMPNGAAIDLAVAIIKRWKDNPYSIRPIIAALSLHPDYVKSQQGDSEAKARFDTKLGEVAALLEKELPSSGIAETLKANFMLSESRYDETAGLLARALSLRPDNAKALGLMASLSAILGKYDEAEAYVERAIELAPNTEGNHSTRAMIAQLRGDIDLAAAEAMREVTVYYGNISATLLAANMALVRQRPLEALDRIDAFPDDGTWFNVIAPIRAQAYLMLGRFRDARRILDRLERDNPSNPTLDMTMVIALLSEGRIEAARERTDRIANPLVKSFMTAFIALSENDVASAERMMEQIESSGGVDKTFSDELVPHIMGTKGDLEGAERALHEHLSRKPYDVAAETLLIANNIETGKVAVARQRFDDLMKEHDELFCVRQTEPILLLREERFREALASANSVLKDNPRDSGALSAKGFALLKRGNERRAVDIADRLIGLLPKSPAGYHLKARAYFAMGKLSKAEAFLKKSIEVEIYDSTDWPMMSSSALAKDIEAAKASKRK